MTHLSTIISKYEGEFDKQFGKDGPEGNSDSVGRSAGCDDCSENIELRAEHKEFLRTFALELVKEAFAQTKVEKIVYTAVGETNDLVDGYNTAIDEVEARQQEFINEQK